MKMIRQFNSEGLLVKYSMVPVEEIVKEEFFISEKELVKESVEPPHEIKNSEEGKEPRKTDKRLSKNT